MLSKFHCVILSLVTERILTNIEIIFWKYALKETVHKIWYGLSRIKDKDSSYSQWKINNLHHIIIKQMTNYANRFCLLRFRLYFLKPEILEKYQKISEYWSGLIIYGTLFSQNNKKTVLLNLCSIYFSFVFRKKWKYADDTKFFQRIKCLVHENKWYEGLLTLHVSRKVIFIDFRLYKKCKVIYLGTKFTL